MKPGWKTSEFWVTVGTIGSLVLAWAETQGGADSVLALVAAAAVAAAYAVARGLAKGGRDGGATDASAQRVREVVLAALAREPGGGAGLSANGKPPA